MLRRELVGWTLVPAALALLGIGVAVLTHAFAARYERDRLRARFGEYVTVRTMAIAGEMQSLGELLHSVQGLFNSSDDVNAAEFGIFTRGPLDRLPAVHAIEWARVVPRERRADYEASVQAEGQTPYAIVECDPAGRTRPAGDRRVYYPVRYVAPLEGNEPALGLDLGFEAARLDTLRRAFRTGRPAVSPCLTLVQEPADSHAILMCLPVMRGHGPALSDGPANGFVVLVLRVEDLIPQALATVGDDVVGTRPAGMTYELLESERGQPPRLIHRAESYREGVRPVERSIEIGDRQWTVRAQPTLEWLAGRSTHQPILLALGAFAGWIAVMGSLLYLGRRARDRQTREQESMIHSVLANLDEGVVVADVQGNLLFVNPTARKLIGSGAGRPPSGTWSITYGFHRPDRITLYPETELPLSRAIRGERTGEEEIYVKNARRPKGVWVNTIATPLRDETGKVLGGVVVMRDSTARRESEEEIRRLSNAVEQTADAVLIADRDGVIQYVNPAFESTTGYSRADAVGKTPRLLKSGRHKQAFYERLWTTIQGREVFHATMVNRRKDGTEYHSEQTITPMLDAEGHITHFVAVGRDMTERRRLHEQELEVRLAAQIQGELYPKTSPVAHGLQVAGAVFPAEATCGDYFDYLPLPDGRLAIVVGDVSGHGLGPALIMSQVRAYVRSLIAGTEDLGGAMTRLNDVLEPDLRNGLFVTMVVTCIDPQTRRLLYASAGHTPCYVLSPDGTVRHALKCTGIPLGLDHGARYEARDGIQLEEGDVVLLLTDGATEARSPEGTFLLDEGVLDLVRDHLDESAEEILERVHEGVRAFSVSEAQLDDITLVVLKCVTGETSAETLSAGTLDG